MHSTTRETARGSETKTEHGNNNKKKNRTIYIQKILLFCCSICICSANIVCNAFARSRAHIAHLYGFCTATAFIIIIVHIVRPPTPTVFPRYFLRYDSLERSKHQISLAPCPLPLRIPYFSLLYSSFVWQIFINMK